jgi:hypothetical protein
LVVSKNQKSRVWWIKVNFVKEDFNSGSRMYIDKLIPLPKGDFQKINFENFRKMNLCMVDLL